MLTSLLSISLGAILINNFIFSQFLGICPFLGCSNKMDTAAGMGLAVIFVMGLASALCWMINEWILITTNCAVLGVVLLNTQNNYNFIESVVYGITGGIGFLVAICLLASVREKIEFADYPKAFEGFAIALVTGGLLSLAFMGFSGMKIF